MFSVLHGLFIFENNPFVWVSTYSSINILIKHYGKRVFSNVVSLHWYNPKHIKIF